MKVETHKDRLIKELTQLSQAAKHSKFHTARYSRWINEVRDENITDPNLKKFLDSKASFQLDKYSDYSLYLMFLSEHE